MNSELPLLVPFQFSAGTLEMYTRMGCGEDMMPLIFTSVEWTHLFKSLHPIGCEQEPWCWEFALNLGFGFRFQVYFYDCAIFMGIFYKMYESDEVNPCTEFVHLYIANVRTLYIPIEPVMGNIIWNCICINSHRIHHG